MEKRREKRGFPGKERGFTLIELLVVVTILGLLGAVVGPALINKVKTARTSAAQEQIRIFELALKQYYLDNGTFPTTEQGLAALREKPSLPPAPTNWNGPYLEKPIPKDPWGRPYHYLSPGQKSESGYDLYSLGADGKEGGRGEDRDITNWETSSEGE